MTISALADCESFVDPDFALDDRDERAMTEIVAIYGMCPAELRDDPAFLQRLGALYALVVGAEWPLWKKLCEMTEAKR